MRHQSRKCGDNRDRFSLKKLAQNSHPFLNQLITVNVCLIKDQVLCRKIIGFSTIQLAIIQQLLRLHITVCHDQLHIILFRKSIYHMKLLGIIQSGKGNMPFSSVQKCFSLFKLRQFPKRSCQYLHAMPSPLFARYTRSSLHPDLFPESSAPLHRLPPKPASSAPAPPDQNVPAHSPQGRSLPVFPRRRP